MKSKFYAMKVKVFRWLLYNLAGDSNYLSHARHEMSTWNIDENGPDKWMYEGTLDLLCVLAMQGHSGGSNGWAVSNFARLAQFKLLRPLTGEDDEWMEVSDNLFQNKRASHVFKRDGKAYDIDGRIFREPDGVCYTNLDSHVPVVFPYMPHTEYVDLATEKETNVEPS